MKIQSLKPKRAASAKGIVRDDASIVLEGSTMENQPQSPPQQGVNSAISDTVSKRTMQRTPELLRRQSGLATKGKYRRSVDDVPNSLDYGNMAERPYHQGLLNPELGFTG